MQTTEIQAWAFPDNSIDPTSDIEFIKFDTLKLEWAQVTAGLVVLRDNSSYGANFFYNTANALLCTQNSKTQYLEISCGTGTDMDALCSDPTNRSTSIATIMSFLATTGFNGGASTDFEGYGGWTSGQYTNFKIFCDELRAALNAVGLKLIVNVPAIWNDAGTVDAGSPYEWRTFDSSAQYVLTYEDMALHADYLVPLVYDWMYESSEGVGQPLQPLEWLSDTAAWAQLKIYPNSKIIIGIPAYGYSGTSGYTITDGLDFNFMSGQSGFSTATRDITGAPTDSGELTWINGGLTYFAIDDQAVMLKVNRLLSTGITKYSLWFIGSNRYGNPQGKSSALNQGLPVSQYETPSTGDTIDIAINTTSLQINPSGTLAALTLAFVDGLYDGQGIDITFSENITALSVSGSNFTTAFPGSVPGGANYRAIWSSSAGTWSIGLVRNFNLPMTVFTPTTGQTVNLLNNAYNVINPTGALLALTVNFPSSPLNGDTVELKFEQAVTTVTYTGGTVKGSLVSPVLGSYAKWTFDGVSTWY